MIFTILKKLKRGDFFRKVLYRKGSSYLSKKKYYFRGYEKDCNCYFYYCLDNNLCVEYISKNGEFVVVKEVKND